MKGKKIYFNRKDTYNLNNTLNPIICAGLKKFKEVSLGDSHAGTPCMILTSLYPEVKHNYTEEQATRGFETWIAYLDKMIYAFEDKEPNICEYKFEFVAGEGHGEETGDGHFSWNMLPDNKEVYEQYVNDVKNHVERVQEGLDLFGKYYTCLWW